MAKPALLIRIYGSIENARAAYALDSLRAEIRCAERKLANDRAILRPAH